MSEEVATQARRVQYRIGQVREELDKLEAMQTKGRSADFGPARRCLDGLDGVLEAVRRIEAPAAENA